MILASHLVLHAYGQWLPNDPRGSGSESIRKEELQDLGPVHTGRKRIQPSRAELKGFYEDAEPLLENETIWFDERMRQAIGIAFGVAARECGYTIYACAVCRNHAHVVVRTHRDRADVIWHNLASAATDALRSAVLVPQGHPVWSHRPYKVFLYTPDEVRGRIEYVRRNPIKEGLREQKWDFVKAFG